MKQFLFSNFIKCPLIIRLLIISISIIILFGVTIHWIEPKNFKTIFDGIWWATVTASTVGFGDFSPKTVLGRTVAIFLILIGASFFTYYFANLATVAVTKQNEYFEGKRVFKGMEHIIIIGWNERSRELIAELEKKEPSTKIVLIDETLTKLPIPFRSVHFISGRANCDDTLMKANVTKAKGVIITADPNKEELHSDMNTILTMLAIKGISPSVLCIAEILTNEQVKNAERAGADKIIRSNLLLSSVMLNSISTN